MKLEGLKVLRNKNKISRAQLALDINISQTTIKKLETQDNFFIDKEILKPLCNYFKVTIEQLISEDFKNVRICSLPIKVNGCMHEKFFILPDNITDNQKIQEMYNTMLDRYVVDDNVGISKSKVSTFLKEFRYRLGDIPSDKDTTTEGTKKLLDSLDGDILKSTTFSGKPNFNKFGFNTLEPIQMSSLNSYEIMEINKLTEIGILVYTQLSESSNLSSIDKEELFNYLMHFMYDEFL